MFSSYSDMLLQHSPEEKSNCQSASLLWQADYSHGNEAQYYRVLRLLTVCILLFVKLCNLQTIQPSVAAEVNRNMHFLAQVQIKSWIYSLWTQRSSKSSKNCRISFLMPRTKENEFFFWLSQLKSCMYRMSQLRSEICKITEQTFSFELCVLHFEYPLCQNKHAVF